MAKKRELEIIIDKEGRVSVKIKGFPGKACNDVAKILEDALGEIKEEEHTSEYYEQEEENNINLESNE
ncbi:MAG TPA: DUF2997 domain-containing protein [Firmicutes bacterium]|nr:DUF2997 domain-containing protein [Bacillota bacterium]